MAGIPYREDSQGQSRMDTVNYKIDGKTVYLYPASDADRPLIVMNEFDGDGSAVLEAVQNTEKRDFSLLCVSGIDWDKEMSPWACPPVYPKGEPCTGGADEYLAQLRDRILPEALELLGGRPSGIGIAGYSLAGLFALYALYRTDIFDRAASISGSLWFPDFKEYVFSHSMKRIPEKLYLSLGDKEAKTRNPVLKTVQENMEEIAAYYKEQGLDVTVEMNPGNHFRDAEIRCAKGILAIL